MAVVMAMRLSLTTVFPPFATIKYCISIPPPACSNAEAGVTLDQVLEISVPKGWFLPVTPGTKFITIGGAVASDVHGKNHHRKAAFPITSSRWKY